MAVLAIVQSFPYDEVLGGDAAYILALADYLVRAGHEVHGLMTNVSRGRTNPLYRSAYPIETFQSWDVRGAVRVGRRAFLAPHAIQPLKIANRLTANRFFSLSTVDLPVEKWAEAESEWVNKKLEYLKPAAAILVHEALYFAPFIATRCAKFALLGHIPVTQDKDKRSDAVRWDDLRRSAVFRSRLSSALKRADGVGLNSREDLVFVQSELGVSSAIFVGMGYGGISVHADSDEPIILFVGNATGPNISALSWFISSIWPGILTNYPQARLRVVGRVAWHMDRTAARQIDWIGSVDDLTPEYKRAQLVVVPLVSGTAGVKIKVAEAMAHGRPVVTTTVGVDARDPHQLDEGAIVTDSASEFAAAVVSLLRDPRLRKLKGEGARKVFEGQFSYKACYGELDQWLAQIGDSVP